MDWVTVPEGSIAKGRRQDQELEILRNPYDAQVDVIEPTK
jgi:hypothetical protein